MNNPHDRFGYEIVYIPKHELPKVELVQRDGKQIIVCYVPKG